MGDNFTDVLKINGQEAPDMDHLKLNLHPPKALLFILTSVNQGNGVPEIPLSIYILPPPFSPFPLLNQDGVQVFPQWLPPALLTAQATIFQPHSPAD